MDHINPRRELPARSAAQLIAAGYTVCRIEPSEKRPNYPRWATHSVAPDDIETADGIGIVCGPISGAADHSLVCIDLDSREAVRLADEYLPATSMVEGRKGKPRSHRWYLVPLASIGREHQSHAPQTGPVMVQKYGHPGPATVSFRSAEKTELIRLIGTGGQAVVPPSMHESGEQREWVGGCRGEPATVDFAVLLAAVKELAKKCGWRVKVAESNTPQRTSMTTAVGMVSPHLDFRLTYRINRYIDALPPAIAGQSGHDDCYRAACALVWGFALEEPDAIKFLKRFNARCQPRWSESELQHKVADAANATDHVKPYGHLV